MPRDLYSCAWDFARLGLGTVGGANAAVFGGTLTGNVGFASGVYMHGNVQATVDGVPIALFISGIEGIVAGLSVTFNASTCRYTLSAAGNFTVTWSGAQGVAMRDLLGFSANLSAASTYTSTQRPQYLIIARLAGQSQVHETYEPAGRISYAESDNGQSYSTHPVELPTYRDWVQPFETQAGPTDAEWSASPGVGGTAVRIADVGAATKVTWTWEHLYKHLRATLPFALVDRTAGLNGASVYKIRGDSAHFDPTRVTADYDGHWSMPLQTRSITTLVEVP